MASSTEPPKRKQKQTGRTALTGPFSKEEDDLIIANVADAANRIRKYEALDLWMTVATRMHLGGYPRTVKAIAVRWQKHLSKRSGIDLKPVEEMMTRLEASLTDPKGLFWSATESGLTVKEAIQGGMDSLGIESQPNWAVGEDEEEGEKRGEGVEEDKEGEEEEGSTSGEEDSPEDIVKRLDRRFSDAFRKESPLLGRVGFQAAVRNQVQVALRASGIQVRKQPWGKLVDACGKKGPKRGAE